MLLTEIESCLPYNVEIDGMGCLFLIRVRARASSGKHREMIFDEVVFRMKF